MTGPVRLIYRRSENGDQDLTGREWLVTNGLGGYSSGTISGVVTRRYHGYLVAALPSPNGRVLMLNQLSEQLKFADHQRYDLGGQDDRGHLITHGVQNLIEFRLEDGLPVWTFKVRGLTVEKRVWMAHRQNTVFIQYRVQGGSVGLRLTPAVHFRYHDGSVSESLSRYVLTADAQRYELYARNSDFPPLRMFLHGEEGSFTIFSRTQTEQLYPIEESRGYEYKGQLFSPGHFWVDLSPGRPATLVASTETWETFLAFGPAQAGEFEQLRRARLISCSDPCTQSDFAASLVLAADQFIIAPAGRTEDAARARAVGDEVRSIIAGYHWFTDWGRDTMISLEGLTLVTGRHQEAAWILRMFAQHVRDGLIPNYFPEGDKQGVYHTADATLWFFEAIARYLDYSGDDAMLRHMLPVLRGIVDHHCRGTAFGIGMDPADGLLRQGATGYQLTWMDAKVDEWVVTPRRGKAVEINALWYNALRLMERWLRDSGQASAAAEVADLAQRAQKSFNARFWNPQTGFLFDVVDSESGGNDAACRPNQLFAVSLRYPVLHRERWAAVVKTAAEQLLTPVGLRSLAPGEANFKENYFGDLRTRDAAYHQGTVWGWLIGPFVDAWLRVHPGEQARARAFLEGFREHHSEVCAGSIAEIFDAKFPFAPRGCIAQAWSVAEVLRCWVKTSCPASLPAQPREAEAVTPS